jgi:16S rRNA (cytosine967-C5)-methyltransferase
MANAVRQRTDRVRLTAYSVLSAVSSRDAYANLLLASALRDADLHGKDAALATELVYGTLRNRGCYDAVISLCADRPIDQIDPAVLDALRLGAHQLLGMRIKSHAAVATTVDLVIEVVGRRPSGFANAVLRRIAPRDLESWIQIAAPDRSKDLTGHLSVRYSHPRWIVAAIADALGEDLTGSGGPGSAGTEQTEAALAADADRPIVHLATVPGLAEPAELVASGAAAAQWSPFGAYLSHGDPGEIAAVADGRAWVQDEASQLAACALANVGREGEEGQPGSGPWLDLCAGPGGKARLLGGLAAQRGTQLLAVDVHRHRAELVRSSFDGLGGVLGGVVDAEGGPGRAAGPGRDGGPASRLGPGSIARVVVADGTAPAWRAGAFDRVLADVPCSGLGSLRRRPEARWRRQPDDIAVLAGLQRDLLTSALDATRPGGVVGYVTCSPHVAETRQVLADVLGVRGGIEVLDAPGVLADVPELRCPEPYSRYAQFWPHRHGTDAIFVALLRVAR